MSIRPSKVLKLTIGDTTKPVSEWQKLSTVSIDAIRRRLANGMSPKDAVFLPSSNIMRRTA